MKTRMNKQFPAYALAKVLFHAPCSDFEHSYMLAMYRANKTVQKTSSGHRGLKNCIVELNRRIYGLQKRLEEKKGGRINDTETKAVYRGISG